MAMADATTSASFPESQNQPPQAIPPNENNYEAAIAEISLPRDLDLTGGVEKVDPFPFESGAVADISLGSMKSKKMKEQMVAIKIFRRIHIDRNVLEITVRDIYDEAKVWSKLEDPNVLRFLGIALDLGPSPALITPYCHSGSIMRYLTEVPKTPEERLALGCGIAQGLSYIHSKGLVHGNLTTKKVLINSEGLAVISGYGLANISHKLSKNTTISPSARFTAPEFFIDESTQQRPAHKTAAGDVYSFSMVILEIMSGVRPYYHLNSEVSVVLHILPGGRPSRSELDPFIVSDRLWGLLKQLWTHQPALRPEMNRAILALKSLQSGSEKPEGSEIELASSVLVSSFEETDTEEEVSFGHPCLSEINSQNLKGRLFRTDEYPCATGGNSNIYRGQLIQRNGYRVQAVYLLPPSFSNGVGVIQAIGRD